MAGRLIHAKISSDIGALARSYQDQIRAGGPVGRFFLWADTAARDRGVTLFFGSLQDLIEANRADSDSWRPLVPVFDEALAALRRREGLS